MFKTNYMPWFIWVAAAIFYLYEMLLRVSNTVMTQQLMEAFQVTATTLGIVTSCYYYSYNVLQIPCGIIVDKLGPRLIISLSSALCVVGAYLFYSAHSVEMASFARFVMGAGSACAFVGTLKLTSAWFPSVQFAMITGFTVMLGKMGGASQCIMAPIVEAYGWRFLMYCLSLSGIFVTLLCWFVIRNKPKHSKVLDSEKLTLKTLMTVISNKQVWIVGLVGGFMYIPITGFGELWSTPFLMCVCEIDNISASQITALLYFGFALGGPLFALIANKIKSHVRTMIISCVSALIVFSFICYGAHFLPHALVKALYLIAGATAGGQVLCFTIAKENLPIGLSGTTVGFTNTLVMISAPVFQPLIGRILDYYWTGQKTEAGVRIYEKIAFQTASLSIPIGMALCIVLLLFVKETFSDKK